MKSRFAIVCSLLAAFVLNSPLSFWVTLVAYLSGVLILQFMPLDVVKYLNSEAGPFEQGSVAIWIAAAFLACSAWLGTRAGGWLAGSVVLIYAALRELDFQTLFTYRSVMSLGYFTGSRATTPEKLIALAVMMPCIVALIFLARQLYQLIIRGLLNRARIDLHRLCVPLLWVAILFVWSHLHDRGSFSWIRFSGHIEALNEATLAMLVLMFVIELKPTLLKQPDS